jgi:hypothetical protein
MESEPGHPCTPPELPGEVERCAQIWFADSPVSDAPKPAIVWALSPASTVMTGFEAVPVGAVVTDRSGKVVCESGLALEGLITVAVTEPSDAEYSTVTVM